MFKPKVQFEHDAWERIKMAAEFQGCASPEEFVERIVSAEVNKILDQRTLQQSGKAPLSEKEVEDIANKMKGLGYLE